MVTTDDLARMQMRIEELETAIRRHRDATGHQMCWENDHELWAVLGGDPPDRVPPPLPEFMQCCAAYWQSRQQTSLTTRTPTILWSAINAIRIQRDLTDAELGAEIGVSRASIQRWKHGGFPSATAMLAAEAWLARQQATP